MCSSRFFSEYTILFVDNRMNYASISSEFKVDGIKFLSTAQAHNGQALKRLNIRYAKVRWTGSSILCRKIFIQYILWSIFIVISRVVGNILLIVKIRHKESNYFSVARWNEKKMQTCNKRFMIV